MKYLNGLLLTIGLALLSNIIAPYLGRVGVVTIATLFRLGYKTIIMVIFVQTVTIISGYFIGRLFGFSKKFSTLLGVGNAVCGSSAIVAVSPVIEAEQSEIGISIGVVNLLGTVGIFAIPALALSILNYNDQQTASLIGGSLQAVGQVVASGFSVNETVGEMATLIKMSRIVMLGPIIIIISLLGRGTNSTTKSKNKFQIPAIVVGFICLAILRIILDSTTSLGSGFWGIEARISKFILTTAMVAIGMKIKFKDLIREGHKAILVGLSIFIVEILALILFIHWL